jgi:carbonic anhydrase
MAGGDNGHNLNHLLAHLQPALHACPDGDVDTVVRENAIQTVNGLTARSRVIREAAEADLDILPAWYILETGQVDLLV